MSWADDFTWVEKSTGLGPTNLNKINKAIRELKGLTFNVKDYGAVGDGVTDDTATITAAFTAARAVSGDVFFPLPSAHYKITSAIQPGFSPGMRIFGEGVGTIIIQYTNNTPIFLIDQNNMHSWEIHDLQLGYASTQSSSNTAACPIYFSGPASVTESEIYNFKIRNVLFMGGYYGIGSDATKRHTVWGLWADNLLFGSLLSGGAVNLDSAYVSGRPNIHLQNIYVRADNMVGPIFYVPAAESSSMDAIEINLANLGPTILKEWGGGSWSIGAFKVEGGTYTSSALPMFDLASGFYTFDTLILETLTANAGWTLPVFFRDASGGNTRISIRHLMLDAVVTGTTAYVSRMGGATSRLTIGDITRALPTNVLLTDIGSTGSADETSVTCWNQGQVSADKGDANYTVAVGDPNVISYETNLTATRTVTLPNSQGGNVFNGLKYRITRSGAGAFALNINDASGPTLLDSIASGKTGAIEYTYRRAKWVQTLKALA